MNVKLLLQQQGLSVRQLAAELEVPLKTVQDWVYRGVVPSPANQAKLDEVVQVALSGKIVPAFLAGKGFV